jgi:hypothetical protein
MKLLVSTVPVAAVAAAGCWMQLLAAVPAVRGH